jgi:hypothetical protein
MTPSLSPLTAAGKRELIGWDTKIKNPTIGNRSMTIAYYGWRIKKSGRWAELGCTDELSYIRSRSLPFWQWKRCVRVGMVFEALSFDRLLEIGVRKIRVLNTINPEIWQEYDWLSECQRLSVMQLSRLIDERNRAFDNIDSSAFAVDKNATHISSPDDPTMIAAARHASKLIGIAIHKMMKSDTTRHSPKFQDVERVLRLAQKRLRGAVKLSTAATVVDVAVTDAASAAMTSTPSKGNGL